jgi:hypothetical protein
MGKNTRSQKEYLQKLERIEKFLKIKLNAIKKRMDKLRNEKIRFDSDYKKGLQKNVDLLKDYDNLSIHATQNFLTDKTVDDKYFREGLILSLEERLKTLWDWRSENMDKREKKYLQCKIEPEYLFVRL